MGRRRMRMEDTMPPGSGTPGERKARVREVSATYGAIEVPASDLKNDWHHWLDQVSRGRRRIVVTRYGRPVAILSPAEPLEPSRGFVGALAGWVLAEGDLVSPAGEDWEAEG